MATKTKSLQLTIPDYLTIQQYMDIKKYEGDSNWEKMVSIISAILNKDIDEVKTWTVDSLKKVYTHIQKVADPGLEFHSILEWNGQMYGYAPMKKASLGEYVDLENLCKDVNNNLHKIAALMYRPIVKHKFNDLAFTIKQSLKVANKKGVENVFDYYTVEEYSSDTRSDREEEFKHFPVSIILGALSFFLTTANLYLSSTVSSEDPIMSLVMKKKEEMLLDGLSEAIGAGGGLFTHSVSPIYSQLQGINPSQIST